jgi:hypothetical protein
MNEKESIGIQSPATIFALGKRGVKPHKHIDILINHARMLVDWEGLLLRSSTSRSVHLNNNELLEMAKKKDQDRKSEEVNDEGLGSGKPLKRS